MAEKCPTIVAVKEATGSLDQASQIAALCDLTILSGDDSLTLPLMSIGGKGVVSVVGNIVPRDMMALVKAFAAGKIAEAQQWHRKLFPLCRDMLGVATNPIPVKAAMKLLGRGISRRAHCRIEQTEVLVGTADSGDPSCVSTWVQGPLQPAPFGLTLRLDE